MYSEEEVIYLSGFEYK